jgi:hypothetical protein
MQDIGKVELSSGLLTLVNWPGPSNRKRSGSRILRVGRGLCSEGIEIGVLLAQVVDDERGRVARRRYDTIANSGTYQETFDLFVGAFRRTVVMKERVGDVLFTCIVAPVAAVALVRTLSLLNTWSSASDEVRIQ